MSSSQKRIKPVAAETIGELRINKTETHTWSFSREDITDILCKHVGAPPHALLVFSAGSDGKIATLSYTKEV